MRVHMTVTDDNGNAYEGTVELVKTTGKTVPKAKKPKVNPPSVKIEGPAGAIRKLYHAYFFKTPKTLQQVMKKLSDEGINFDVRLVSMALYRAKYLTPKGSRGNYTYVQKQPPG